MRQLAFLAVFAIAFLPPTRASAESTSESGALSATTAPASDSGGSVSDSVYRAARSKSLTGSGDGMRARQTNCDRSGPERPDDSTPTPSFQNILGQMGDVVEPIQRKFFDPVVFHQDALGSEIAVLKSDLDQAKDNDHEACAAQTPRSPSNWVATLKVSGNLFQHPPIAAVESTPGNLMYYSGAWWQYAQQSIPQGQSKSASISALSSQVSGQWGVTDDSNRRYIFNDMVYGRIINATADADWQSALTEGKKNWSTDERLAFVSYFGQRLGANYDLVRGGYVKATPGDPQGGHERGVVTFLDLMKGLRTATPSGVCRDIASAQAQMLQELGFKNVYVMASNSLGGLHATVVAQDPNDPRKLVKFNYGMFGQAPDTAEVNALRQYQDRGTMYQLYKPGGEMVASLPSELGLLLHEASGGNLKEVDVFARNRAPVTGSLRLDHGAFSANVFMGRLSDGTGIIGVAGQVRVHDPSNDKVAIETGGGYAKQSGGVDGIEATHVFARVTQYLNSPWYQLSQSTRLRAESSTQVFVDSSKTGWVLENAGAAVQAKVGNTDVTVRGATQFAGGSRDIRDGYKYGFSHNLTYVRTDVERPIGDTWKAVADVAVGYREFGPQIEAAGGLKKDGQEIRVGYEGATRSDVPAFAYGMSRKVFAEMNEDLKGWTVSVQYLQPLQGDVGAGRTLKSTVTKSWGTKK